MFAVTHTKHVEKNHLLLWLVQFKLSSF